jgi:hypothetical protein
MAEELLANGYKDAAAVMIGGVLEEHLRRLAQRYQIDTKYQKNGKDIPKKADTLNVELVKATAYTKMNQMWILAALGLRNEAAHGDYSQYDKEQVRIMFEDTRNFIANHPA